MRRNCNTTGRVHSLLTLPDENQEMRKHTSINCFNLLAKLHQANFLIYYDMTALKKEIVQAGIKKHLAVMEDFRQRIKDITATDGNVNEEEYDSQVQSHNTEILAEASLLSDQLQFARHELEELKRIDSFLDRKHIIVEFGTVVVTDKATFFVSVSIEEFDVNGKPMFGLSVQSPLYKCMRGKMVGETFTHEGTVYRIKEIF